MQSKATTVKDYLASLPEDRRAAISAVRDVIRRNLGPGYEEGMQYGMIGYYVPHKVYPAGYHCDPRQPLPFAGLASQKQHMSMYLMGVYCGCVDGKDSDRARWFREAWVKAGKKLDMGKACVRFKKLEDVPLEVVGEAIRRMPSDEFIREYETSLAAIGRTPKKAAPANSAPKTAAGKKAVAKKSAPKRAASGTPATTTRSAKKTAARR
jgi:hypothetical protein